MLTAPFHVKTVVGSPVIGVLVAESTSMEPSTASLLVQTSCASRQHLKRLPVGQRFVENLQVISRLEYRAVV